MASKVRGWDEEVIDREQIHNTQVVTEGDLVWDLYRRRYGMGFIPNNNWGPYTNDSGTYVWEHRKIWLEGRAQESK